MKTKCRNTSIQTRTHSPPRRCFPLISFQFEEEKNFRSPLISRGECAIADCTATASFISQVLTPYQLRFTCEIFQCNMIYEYMYYAK